MAAQSSHSSDWHSRDLGVVWQLCQAYRTVEAEPRQALKLWLAISTAPDPRPLCKTLCWAKLYVIGMQESNLFNVPITFQVDESSLNISRWRVFNFVYCNQVRAVLPACKNIGQTDGRQRDGHLAAACGNTHPCS